MRILLFSLLTVALAYSANAQTCTNESHFEWVKKTFEENDAGFQYILDRKGQAAYDLHNQLMLEKIKEAKSLEECAELLNEWLRFFRSGHIGIQLLTNEDTSASQTAQEKGVTEKWNGDIAKFEEYIDTKEEVDFEGIWQVGDGRIKFGIQKEGEEYIGFIYESEVAAFGERGTVTLKIKQDGNEWKGTVFMPSHAELGVTDLIGKNHLQLGRNQGILKRLKPVFEDDLSDESYFKSLGSRNPYLEVLNATTLYLRIPSFAISCKSAIDKILVDNKDKILKTENLIIDIRNGTGGSDASFSNLLPFLYTNPIRNVGMEFLSTTLNNQQFLNYLTEHDFDEGTRQWIQETYDKMQGKEGGFIKIDEGVSILRYDNIHEYPKNVGIIINRGNGSTDEEFLLAAKQSKKVKLFGTPTFGALDISNMLYVDSPCKHFRLKYSLSRSLRIPDMVIDVIGIQPDYFLDKTIPPYKWVDFVNDTLNQW